jgi:hypothetical protein
VSAAVAKNGANSTDLRVVVLGSSFVFVVDCCCCCIVCVTVCRGVNDDNAMDE